MRVITSPKATYRIILRDESTYKSQSFGINTKLPLEIVLKLIRKNLKGVDDTNYEKDKSENKSA